MSADIQRPSELTGLEKIISDLQAQAGKLKEELNLLHHNSREISKETILLGDLLRLLSRTDMTLSEGLQEVLDLIPPLWQYPDETCARIILKGQEFRTTNFIVETDWKHAVDLVIGGEIVGAFEIFYTEGRPEGYDGVLIWEDKCFVETVARAISLYMEYAEIRDRLIQYQADLKVAKEAAREYETSFYNYASRIKAIKSKGEEALDNLRMGIRNIGGGIYSPLKAVLDLSRELTSIESEEERRARIDNIQGISTDLLGLAENIIEYVNLETGQFKYHKNNFSLRDLIGSVIDQTVGEGEQDQPEVVSFVDPLIPDDLIGDDKRLRQILVHLLKDAVANSAGGEVLVRVELEAWEHLLPIFHFSIVSSERTINDDQKERVFQRFTCQEILEMEQVDLALGQAVSKRLVELMGGEIWVESPLSNSDQENSGSAIHFTMWMEIQKKQDETSIKRKIFDEHVGQALVVDDKMTNRIMLRALLESHGWQPVLLSTGQEAIDMLSVDVKKEPAKFDLVLIDAGMPEIDGWEVARRIKDYGWREKAAVMLMISGSQEIDSEGLEQAGLTGAIRKPIRQDELVKLLDDTLARSSPADQKTNGADQSEAGVSPIVKKDQTGGGEGIPIILYTRDRLIQLLLKGLLTKRGYAVTGLNDPDAVFDLAGQVDFSVVLVDLNSSNKRLFEAVGVVRARQKDSRGNFPIIGFTGIDNPDCSHRFIEAGADEYVVTAGGYESLFEKISDRVSQFQSQSDEDITDVNDQPLTFDTDKALATVEGDRGLLLEVIEAFEEESGSYLSRIEKAIGNMDIEELDKNVMALAAVTERLGISGIHDFAKQMLDAAGAKKFDTSRSVFEKLTRRLKKLENDLTRLELNLSR